MNMRVGSDSIVAEEPLVTARLPGEPEETEARSHRNRRRNSRLGERVGLTGRFCSPALLWERSLLAPGSWFRRTTMSSRCPRGFARPRPNVAPVGASAALAQVALPPPPARPCARLMWVSRPRSRSASPCVARWRAGVHTVLGTAGQGLPHLHRRHHQRRGRPLQQRLLLPRPRLAPLPPASTSRRRASCRTSPEAAPPEKRPSRPERIRFRPRWERPRAPRALLRAHQTPQPRSRRRLRPPRPQQVMGETGRQRPPHRRQLPLPRRRFRHQSRPATSHSRS